MKLARIHLCIVILLFLMANCLEACLWDRDTLAEERKKSPQMAELIFGPPLNPADPVSMRARIDSLRREPKENDPNWWNDLAGAYIRLGNPDEAARLLESVVARYPNDYGIHANLGTAYHLLGRYPEAVHEIARDLELNPEGHFGLEKYHLALLQYLARDADYQKQHVYVDVFSDAFTNEWHELFLMEIPSAMDTNLQAGVIYMASLNPKEPACFVMLGVAALQDVSRNRDLHLAIAAFEKAIRLGSPQEALLRAHIAQIKSHLQNAGSGGSAIVAIVTVLMLGVGLVFLIVFVGARIWRRKSASKPNHRTNDPAA